MRKVILFIFLLALILTVYNIFPEKKLANNAEIDLIVVNKSERQLMVFSNGKLLKAYLVPFGGNPKGHKEFEGDEKTPEGVYRISAKMIRVDITKI